MTRIAMTIPQELLNEFDEVCKEKGHTSRRKGLEDAMKDIFNNINSYKNHFFLFIIFFRV